MKRAVGAIRNLIGGGATRRRGIAVAAGAAVAVLVAALVVVATVDLGAAGDDADVLGVTVEREAPDDSPGSPGADDDAGDADPDPGSSQGAAPEPGASGGAAPPGGGDAPVSTAPAAPPAAEPAPPPPQEEVVTVTDAAFFTYREDPNESVAGSATTVERDDASVRLTVSGFESEGRAMLSASVENASGGAIRFPEGLGVRLTITRDGAPWRTVDLTDPAVVELAPGAQAGVSGEEPLDGYGEYRISGEVRFVR